MLYRVKHGKQRSKLARSNSTLWKSLLRGAAGHWSSRTSHGSPVAFFLSQLRRSSLSVCFRRRRAHCEEKGGSLDPAENVELLIFVRCNWEAVEEWQRYVGLLRVTFVGSSCCALVFCLNSLGIDLLTLCWVALFSIEERAWNAGAVSRGGGHPTMHRQSLRRIYLVGPSTVFFVQYCTRLCCFLCENALSLV